MRLIDADALKEAFKKKCCCEISLDLIDNAPTVEYPFYQEAYQTGYEEGNVSKSNFCPNCGADMRGE